MWIESPVSRFGPDVPTLKRPHMGHTRNFALLIPFRYWEAMTLSVMMLVIISMTRSSTQDPIGRDLLLCK